MAQLIQRGERTGRNVHTGGVNGVVLSAGACWGAGSPTLRLLLCHHVAPYIVLCTLHPLLLHARTLAIFCHVVVNHVSCACNRPPPDGTTAVTYSKDCTARVWDVAKNEVKVWRRAPFLGL